MVVACESENGTNRNSQWVVSRPPSRRPQQLPSSVSSCWSKIKWVDSSAHGISRIGEGSFVCLQRVLLPEIAAFWLEGYYGYIYTPVYIEHILSSAVLTRSNRMRCWSPVVWIASTTASLSASAEQHSKRVLHRCGVVTLPMSSVISPRKLLTLLSVIPTSPCSPTRRTVMDTRSGWWATWRLVV